MRVLLTTVGLAGHLFPLVPLAWALRVRGHEVLVATTGDFLPTVLRAGLPARAWSSSGPVADLVAAGRLPGEEQRFAHGLAFAGVARRSLPGAEELVREWRPDLVVSERAELAGPLVAARHGLPRVELHWGAGRLTEYRSAWETESAAHTLGAPDVVLNPWPPSLRAAYAENHQSIRHVPYNGDAAVPRWVTGRRRSPRVCLTFGTLLPHLGGRDLGEFAVPLLRRLGSLEVELLVAIDDRVAAGWPALPDRVRYAGRLPLAEVLRTCAVSVNHAGQGTSLTALGAACPQVMIPQFDDQFDNAAATAKAGAGLMLLPEETTADTVHRACEAVLRSAGHRTAAGQIAAEIAAQPSPAEVAAGLEKRF